MKKCRVCGRMGNMHKHHIIHGHGKRRACETAESLIDICFDCHKLVHGGSASGLDLRLRLQLQADYFKKGYETEDVFRLLDGKLYLVNGCIWGLDEK